MYNWGNDILNLTMVGVTLWITSKFLGIFLEKKQTDILSVLSWMMYGGFQLFVEYHKGVESTWVMVGNIVLLYVISVTTYHKSGKSNFFIAISLMVIWSLLEMLIFFSTSVLPLEGDEFYLLGSVISKILMILCVHLFSVFWRKKEYKQISPKYLYGLLFIPIGSIVIALNEFFGGNIKSQVLPSMVVFSILLLFNLIIFEIYAKLAESFAYEREKTAYEQQIAIISKSTEEQKKIMEDFHEQKHNLVNELIVLKNSAEKDNNADLIENLNHIIKGFDSKEKIASSGNNVVDAIINVKYAIAKENRITFNLKIFIPEELPFHQCDLGIVLGNAIDNAIEAVKDCATEKRVIDISMGIKKEALILTVGNKYEHPLKTDKKGNLLTTKEKQSGHGYGIKSIQRVAEKYHGEVLIETENNQFILTVIMNLEQGS